METIKKTGYEWCLESNMRVLDLKEWPVGEDGYFTDKIDKDLFVKFISECTVKPNSQPRKTDKYLITRMYGMVPYNLSPIQQGIQFGHAVVRYGRSVRGIGIIEETYNRWADKYETFIILNGGTTNNNPERLGTLNKHLITLENLGVQIQSFYEPDLGDQLTAICFLVDERVFDKTLYPDFIPETLPWGRRKPSEDQLAELELKNNRNYVHWLEKIGGERNAFLREYLKTLRLA